MSRSLQYFLILLVLLVPTGCETVKGAATGFGQDVQNSGDPDKNGWNVLEGWDAWMQKNLW